MLYLLTFSQPVCVFDVLDSEMAFPTGCEVASACMLVNISRSPHSSMEQFSVFQLLFWFCGQQLYCFGSLSSESFSVKKP